MFAIFKKIINKNNDVKLRGADELFSSGNIFSAENKELDNILKELTASPVSNSGANHIEIIRAITVLTIKNNKNTENIQLFNIFLSVVIILLTIYSILLTKQQTDYTEISTRSDRILQNTTIRNAFEYCKQNPDSLDSGLKFTESGKTASCTEVLKNENLDKYKN